MYGLKPGKYDNSGEGTVNGGNYEILVRNAWDVLNDPKNYRKFDKISCLEMSEHIGIRDYQKFTRQVRKCLKDDGIYYLQIAGLRRTW